MMTKVIIEITIRITTIPLITTTIMITLRIMLMIPVIEITVICTVSNKYRYDHNCSSRNISDISKNNSKNHNEYDDDKEEIME